MMLDRTVRSNAPSPSSRYSQPSGLTRATNLNFILPTPGIPDMVSRTVFVPKIPHSSSPDAHLSSCSRPYASATHRPALPLTFHWRCCRAGCRANNAVVTSTHFTQLHHISLPGERRYCAPSYRLSKCAECEHQACEYCLLLQVEGQSEWRGSDSETDPVGVWLRIGMWEQGRQFGGNVQQEAIRREDVVKGLETEERVDQRWAQKWLREREWTQKVSSR